MAICSQNVFWCETPNLHLFIILSDDAFKHASHISFWKCVFMPLMHQNRGFPSVLIHWNNTLSCTVDTSVWEGHCSWLTVRARAFWMKYKANNNAMTMTLWKHGSSEKSTSPHSKKDLGSGLETACSLHVCMSFLQTLQFCFYLSKKK